MIFYCYKIIYIDELHPLLANPSPKYPNCPGSDTPLRCRAPNAVFEGRALSNVDLLGPAAARVWSHPPPSAF